MNNLVSGFQNPQGFSVSGALKSVSPLYAFLLELGTFMKFFHDSDFNVLALVEF